MASPYIQSPPLPTEIVLAPSWWHRHAGITFDEDFFYHRLRRVEAERKMEDVLHERFGRYGLGRERGLTLPVVGAVHLAAGYLISEMLGCRVEYVADGPPVVHCDCRERLDVQAEAAPASPAFRKLEVLMDALEARHGALVGDVNWGGVLNVALDLRGQDLFLDMLDRPDEVAGQFERIAAVIETFTEALAGRTGTTSISVNRNVRHIARPVFLHSECSHTMISCDDYERLLMPLDQAWCRRHRPFGIHYCGADPHRFAESFAKLEHLDFLDVGWGGDLAALRRHLPHTFLNIRYSPVEIARQSPDEIRSTVRRLVKESGDPRLTGVCCINMDQDVRDEQIEALLDETRVLREEYESRRS